MREIRYHAGGSGVGVLLGLHTAELPEEILWDHQKIRHALDEIKLPFTHAHNTFVARSGLAESINYAFSLQPVSYTHLDVYKRQQLFRYNCAGVLA